LCTVKVIILISKGKRKAKGYDRGGVTAKDEWKTNVVGRKKRYPAFWERSKRGQKEKIGLAYRFRREGHKRC